MDRHPVADAADAADACEMMNGPYGRLLLEFPLDVARQGDPAVLDFYLDATGWQECCPLQHALGRARDVGVRLGGGHLFVSVHSVLVPLAGTTMCAHRRRGSVRHRTQCP